MRKTLTFLFYFGLNLIYAQNGLTKTEFDLGVITAQNDDVIDLNLVNKTENDVFILRVDRKPQQSVLLSSKLIKSKEAILLRIKFNPQKKGTFEEEIGVFLSSNIEPVLLKFRGEVKQFPKNKLQSCPSFGQNTQAQTTFLAHEKRVVNEIQSEFVEFIDMQSIEDLQQASYETLSAALEMTMEENVLPITSESPPESSHLIKNESIVEKNINQSLLDNNYKPNNIVFLIDASTSMREAGRMELLKTAMIKLMEPLRSVDYLSIVTYSGEATILMPPTSGEDKSIIQTSIENIPADGSTQAVKGIKEAIEVGMSNLIQDGNNQIFLASDGAFDIGDRNTRLRKQISTTAESGLLISVIGIKNENWTAKRLKEIAYLGGGTYVKIKSEKDTDQVLEEMKINALK